MAQLVGPVTPVDFGEKGSWTQVCQTQLIIRTEFPPKSKKIGEATCQIRLGGYHSRPIGLPLILGRGSLAQLVEQLAFNQLVAGSNPARPTNFPFSSAQGFLKFKASSQKQFMKCDWETLESENWVRRMPVCYFGGYRSNGPENTL